MRPRHHVPGLLQLVEHRRDVDHVGGLHPEVELLHDRLGEQFDQRRWVGQRSDGDPADEVRCQPGHHPQVLAHQSGDAGSLDLDHDLLSRVQRCRVDLGDRGRGERRAVEGGEHALERNAEVFFDHRADGVEWLGRHLIAALLELLHELRRKDAFATRDDLAELDVGRSEPLGRSPKTNGDVAAACFRRSVPAASLAVPPRADRARPGDRRRQSPEGLVGCVSAG